RKLCAHAIDQKWNSTHETSMESRDQTKQSGDNRECLLKAAGSESELDPSLIRFHSGWKKATQTKQKNMKELIIRLSGAMALAVTLVLTGSGPLCAEPAPGAALSLFDRIYQQSLLSMQNQARRVGLAIDTDIEVLVGASSHVLIATIDGFENIRLDVNGPNE